MNGHDMGMDALQKTMDAKDKRIQELKGALQEIVSITDSRVPSGVGYNCRMIATEVLGEKKEEKK